MSFAEETSQEPVEIIEYFYTTKVPHVWASRPTLSTDNPETGEPIKSLEEAKSIALRLRVPGYHEDSIETAYGMQTRFKHGPK